MVIAKSIVECRPMPADAIGPSRACFMQHLFAFDMASSRGRGALAARLAMLVLCATLAGCAAFSNPVASAVPVRLLPPDLLFASREHLQPIPPSALRSINSEANVLGPGDILGVFIDGVLGEANQTPPVSIPDSIDAKPSLGFPVPVRQNGTVSLPLVGDIEVAGLTIEQAESKIVQVFTDRQILREGRQRVIVTWMRPRDVRVYVVREDGAPSRRGTSIRRDLFSSTVVFPERSDAASATISLPAGENDVLSALTRTGGMPVPETAEEIIIERSVPASSGVDADAGAMPELVRIPVLTHPAMPLGVNVNDVALRSGDIVRVTRREPQFFYCGGLLPSGEYPLSPTDDLTVVEAVSQIGGPLVNGGINASNLSGQIVAPGVGNPSPSLLTVIRKLPGDTQVAIRVDLNQALQDPRENILIGPNDMLILQETPGEAATRYATQVFSLRFFGTLFERSDAVGTADLIVP
jgi:protein involved in polysaccharide export with SLBB domain